MNGKKIWVLGAGAIGSVMAGKLRPEHRCVLIDAWLDHIEEIRAHGLQIEYPEGATRISPQIFGIEEIEQIGETPDVVLLAVKSPQTAGSVERILPWIGEETAVVSLQNGINEDLVAGLVGRQRTIGAAVDYGGEMLGPGRVRGYALDAGVLIGELDGSMTPRLEALTQLVTPEIPIKPTDNIWGALWSKLIINAQVNALCALAGVPTDELAADEMLRRMALVLAKEVITVTSALELELDPAFLDGEPQAYLAIPADGAALAALEQSFGERWGGESFKPSMLQDVEKGRSTEIDGLNGYVAEKARSLDLSAAANEAVVELVKAAERDGFAGARETARDDLAEVYSRLVAA